MPSSTARPPGAAELRRERDRDGGAGGLDDEVELGRGPACRRPRGRPRWRRAGARARAPPRARRRRRSATASAGRRRAIASAPSVPTPITPTASPGFGVRLLEAAQDDRRRLDEDAGVEGDVLGQAVHDLLGHRDELGVAARPREAERLDALAPLRLAAAAAPAAMADDEALADDAVAHLDRLHVGPDLDDGARPLVAGDDREAHPSRVGEDAGHHLDVGPAQTGLAALDEDVVRPPRPAPAPLGRRPRGVPRRRPPSCAKTILRAVSATADLAGPLLVGVHGRPHRRARPPRPPAADAAARARPAARGHASRRARLPGARTPAPQPRLRHVDPAGPRDAGLGAGGTRRRLPDQRPQLRAPRRAVGHLAGVARLRRRGDRRRRARRRLHPARGLPGLRALRDPAGLRPALGAARARRRHDRRGRRSRRPRRLDRRATATGS